LLHPVEVCVKVNVTIPPDRPVTNPAFVTEAIAGLLLVHVPPVVGDKVVVVLAQIVVTPVIVTAGRSLTLVVPVVALQPVAVSVKVKVTGPAEIPVTTPELVTEAITGLLLTHVPPVVGDRTAVLFTQTADIPVTAGGTPTVTAVVVLVHPVDVRVNVKVDDPAAIPVTIPPFVTEAAAGLLLTQVPPVDGDKVVEPPTHTVEVPVILATGASFTTTFVDAELAEHPYPFVTITL
jgi:hypothetical protein